MNIDYDEISQSGNSQKDYNKIHIIKECSKQFNKEKQNLNQEKETNDETVQKSIEDNFKLKLNDDIYNNDDSVLQEGNNSITEQSLKYFESKSSELEDKNIEEKKDKNFLGKKIERNNEEMEKSDKKSKNKKNNQIFTIEKEFIYLLIVVFAKNSEKKNFMDLIENYMLEILRKKTTENSSRKILKKCLQITDKEVAKY